MKRNGFCIWYGDGSRVCDDPRPPQHDCQIIMEYFAGHRQITMGEDEYNLPFLDYPLYGRYMEDAAFDELVERVMEDED